MPYGAPVGGWFDAVGLLLDAAVFDFIGSAEQKSLEDSGQGSDNAGPIKKLPRAYSFTSSDARPTRNSHGRAWLVTQKPGEDGYYVVIWQNGASGSPPGLVFSYSVDGISWSAPVQISNRTGVYPAAVIRPDTNDIYVAYGTLQLSGTVYARVLPYTGVPGSPSWTVNAEFTWASSTYEELSGIVTAAGYGYFFTDNTGGGLVRLNSTVWNAAWDHTQVTNNNILTLATGGGPVWTDAVRTEHFSGIGIITIQQGGQYRIVAWPQDTGTPTLDTANQKTFFAADTEEFSLSYNDTNDRVCLVYNNGGAITYRIYSFDGTTFTLVDGPTIVSSVTSHSPIAQADGDGSFWIVWIAETPSATQRKIRMINTAAPGVVYELSTDSGATSWHDLTGPRRTHNDGLLKLAFCETAGPTNKVYLCTIPVDVIKALAESGAAVEGAFGLRLTLADAGMGADAGTQTHLIAGSECKDNDRALDLFVLNEDVLDPACTKYDINERISSSEILNSGPQLLEAGSATDIVVLSLTGIVDSAFGSDWLLLDHGIIVEGALGSDVVSVDQPNSTSDSASGDDSVLLIVHLDEASTAQDVGFIDLETQQDTATGLDEINLDHGAQEDVALGAEDVIVSVEVDDFGSGDDIYEQNPLGADDVVSGVESLDVMVVVIDDAIGSEGIPWVGPTIDEPVVAIDAASVVRIYGLTIRLFAHSGKVSLRVEGAHTGAVTVRN